MNKQLTIEKFALEVVKLIKKGISADDIKALMIDKYGADEYEKMMKIFNE